MEALILNRLTLVSIRDRPVATISRIILIHPSPYSGYESVQNSLASASDEQSQHGRQSQAAVLATAYHPVGYAHENVPIQKPQPVPYDTADNAYGMYGAKEAGIMQLQGCLTILLN